jgi:peptide subunit release factor 1 (eRF1)/intein/homing endonuclease
VEGKDDIKLWSFEPPFKMNQKTYWCDQTFVLDPLKEQVREKEVYGLIVLDAKEANIGILKGKTIEQLKHMDSTVPSKSVKGGMCVSEDTLIQLENGNIIPIKNLSTDKKILSYSFRDFTPVFTNSFEIFKRRAKKSYELIFEEPSTKLKLTPEHVVFIVGKDGIEEKNVEELNVGDMLLFLNKSNPIGKDDKAIDKSLSQLLGYFLGDGTVDGNRTIFYDKDLQLLNVYKKLAEKVINKKAVISKRRNSYELRLYKKVFADFILSNFPKISKHRRNKELDDRVLVLPKEKLRYFVRGLYDAEGYVDKTGIGLRMTNESIIKKLQLILTRFGIVSSMRGPDKFDRYELRVTNTLYIKNFKKEIGFSSQKKSMKLNLIVKKYKSGFSTRVPISGIFLRKLVESEGLKKEDLKKYSMFLVGKRTLGYPPFGRLIKEIKDKIGDKNLINFLEKVYNSNLITVKIKKKIEIKENKEFYYFYVPVINSFVANGIVVHNSQKRYDRIRDDALNEFFTKVADSVTEALLNKPDLKGIIIGGPGPTKEAFAKGEYLHYELQKKLLGIKDTGYTGEYGLEELVKRSSDLLEKASVVKERQLMERFFSELNKEGNIIYGFDETMKALDSGAVDTLLLSEGFDWVHAKLRCECGFEMEKDLSKKIVDSQVCRKCGKKMKVDETKELIDVIVEKAKNLGTKVEFISTETSEGIQFKELGGIGAFLRYKIG